MSQDSDHIDYRETPDLTEIHAAIQRENKDPIAGVTPVPLWLTLLCGAAICWAGVYVGMFHGGFSGTIYNEFESAPSVLFSLPQRNTSPVGPAAAEDMVAVGKGVYQAVCLSCHQPTGMGQPGAIPPLAGSEWALGSEKRLAAILLKGLTGPVKVKGSAFNGVMPAQEANLSDKKIAAVLTYIRQEWGNKAPEITTAQLASARKEFAGKKVSWTEAELLQISEDAKLEGAGPVTNTASGLALSGVVLGSPTANASSTGELSKVVEEGKKNYMTICVACHQPTGAGLPGAFPPLIKTEYVNGPPDRLAAMVLKGVLGPITVNGALYNSMMPGQEAVLTDEKIAGILTFVRSSFQNTSGPVTKEIVAAARKQSAGRITPWSEAELKAWNGSPFKPLDGAQASPIPSPTLETAPKAEGSEPSVR